MRVIVWALMTFFMLSSIAMARTTIQDNGFFVEGIGYIQVKTITDKNPWGVMVTKIVGFDDNGNLYDFGNGSGEGWVNGAFKGSVAGLAQGAGVATGMALLRPSNTNVDNSSGSGDTVSATGGSGGNAVQNQGQGQFQGQVQKQGQNQALTNRVTNTNINTNLNKNFNANVNKNLNANLNINKVKSTGGGWIPPGQQKK